MTHSNWKSVQVIVAAGATIGLASCSAGNGSGATPLNPPPPPPPAQPIEAQFGSGFAMLFARAMAGEPGDPASGDVIPLSLTADPVDIPDPT